MLTHACCVAVAERRMLGSMSATIADWLAIPETRRAEPIIDP